MDIIIPAFIILAGIIFYILSYVPPKTDLILFGISAVFFLVGGVMGMTGFNDFPTYDTQSVSITTTYENDTMVNNIQYDNTLTDSFFLDVLPAVFVLLSLYQFSLIMILSRKD